MQTNLLWKGRAYESLEHCVVNPTNEGAEINSVIIGCYEQKIYRVDYQIKTNQSWETLFFGSKKLEVKSRLFNKIEHLRFQGDGKGNWTNDGKPVPQFQGCLDIDIALTPFTNTLPINRLQLAERASQQSRVIYLDVWEQQFKPVRQHYTRLSATKYHYENVPNDFEADITVDELGLVVDYPQLFVRVAQENNNSNSHQMKGLDT